MRDERIWIDNGPLDTCHPRLGSTMMEWVEWSELRETVIRLTVKGENGHWLYGDIDACAWLNVANHYSKRGLAHAAREACIIAGTLYKVEREKVDEGSHRDALRIRPKR